MLRRPALAGATTIVRVVGWGRVSSFRRASLSGVGVVSREPGLGWSSLQSSSVCGCGPVSEESPAKASVRSEVEMEREASGWCSGHGGAEGDWEEGDGERGAGGDRAVEGAAVEVAEEAFL